MVAVVVVTFTQQSGGRTKQARKDLRKKVVEKVNLYRLNEE